MKTAVVTGGSSGIGLAVARRLAADGHHVATIDLNPSGTEFGHTADVADAAQVAEALTSIRARLGPVTILVNAVPPGFIDTPMLRKAEDRIGGTIEFHIGRTPVRRVGLPEDVAATCAFLVSDEAGYITGR